MLPEECIRAAFFLYKIMNIAANIDNYEIPDKNWLKLEFDKYAEIRNLIVNELKDITENILSKIDSSLVVSGRIKNFESYFSKYIRLLKTSYKPLITDLLGIRIICPFIEDLNSV